MVSLQNWKFVIHLLINGMSYATIFLITLMIVFIGCLSSIALLSGWPYCCTSFYITVIKITFTLSLNPDIVCIEFVEVDLMASCPRSHTLHQYVSLILSVGIVTESLTSIINNFKHYNLLDL